MQNDIWFPIRYLRNGMYPVVCIWSTSFVSCNCKVSILIARSDKAFSIVLYAGAIFQLEKVWQEKLAWYFIQSFMTLVNNYLHYNSACNCWWKIVTLYVPWKRYHNFLGSTGHTVLHHHHFHYTFCYIFYTQLFTLYIMTLIQWLRLSLHGSTSIRHFVGNDLTRAHSGEYRTTTKCTTTGIHLPLQVPMKLPRYNSFLA